MHQHPGTGECWWGSVWYAVSISQQQAVRGLFPLLNTFLPPWQSRPFLEESCGMDPFLSLSGISSLPSSQSVRAF